MVFGVERVLRTKRRGDRLRRAISRLSVNESWRTMDLLQLEYVRAQALVQHVTSAAADLMTFA
jgi:hypothetical protein